MPDYRRWYEPGGTYFFTVVLYRRQKLFANQLARDLLGNVIREVRQELSFDTAAMVLLYDHLHTIWTLRSGDADFSKRWKLIKGRFTSSWLAGGGTELRMTESQTRRGHRGIWQKRFWEHLIRDEDDFDAHFDYIHYNPVKHGYVVSPRDWPHSSFHRHVTSGVYPQNWGRSEPPNVRGMDCE